MRRAASAVGARLVLIASEPEIARGQAPAATELLAEATDPPFAAAASLTVGRGTAVLGKGGGDERKEEGYGKQKVEEARWTVCGTPVTRSKGHVEAKGEQAEGMNRTLKEGEVASVSARQSGRG